MKYNKYDLTADRVYRILEESNGVHVPLYIPLYHGSPNMRFIPQFGGGSSRHDYGAGLYTTLDIDMAREWAVASPNMDGYVHKYILDTKDLSVLSFTDLLIAKDNGDIPASESLGKEDHIGILTWLATLIKHRAAGDSVRYRKNAEKLISEYYDPLIEEFDVIIGYRADDSYFAFAKQVVSGNANVSLLDDMMHAGNLGDQVFIQSKKAFDNLIEVDMNPYGYFELVKCEIYGPKYMIRDEEARKHVSNLLYNPNINDLTDTIDKYF